uniref:Uncharacterized protein n=1 Tax=Lepeophtheirus salmonis TaxID=72036 RepID=A0A0K2TT36_LEPSM
MQWSIIAAGGGNVGTYIEDDSQSRTRDLTWTSKLVHCKLRKSVSTSDPILDLWT